MSMTHDAGVKIYSQNIKPTIAMFRLSNRPSKFDNSGEQKISSDSYLVYDEMVW